jgi:DNA-binding NtrC family response regulator
LYHRLGVILIQVPALNDRKDDIPLLADHFLGMICDEQGIAKKNVEADAMKELQEYNWTGNIRELRNVVERLVILSGKTITKKDVDQFVKL